MTSTVPSRAVGAWLPLGSPGTDRPRLFCYPNAGAGASSFSHWRSLAPDGVEICPLQPPGRAERYQQPPYRVLDDLLDDLLTALDGQFTGVYALYGHSFGALVVFELTRRLRERGAPLPVHLFVSGRAAPRTADVHPSVHTLPDTELVSWIAELGGTPKAVLAEQELLDLFLPMLRADLQMNETYHYAPGPPLPVPVTVYGGTRDPRANEPQLNGWAENTQHSCTVRMFDGDHFFIGPHARALVTEMTAVLQA